jgi:hypothetical protein
MVGKTMLAAVRTDVSYFVLIRTVCSVALVVNVGQQRCLGRCGNADAHIWCLTVMLERVINAGQC